MSEILDRFRLSRGLMWATASAQSAVIGIASFANPSIAVLLVTGLIFLICCLATPAGFVLFALSVSHIADFPGLSHTMVVIPKWGLVICMLGVLAMRYSVERRQWDLRLNHTEMILCAYIGWHCLCSLTAVYPLATFSEAMRIAAYPALVIVTRESLSTHRQIAIAMLGYVVVVFMSTAYTLFGFSDAIGRWSGLTGNANSLGLVLSLTVPVLVAGFIAARGFALRLLFLSGAVVGVGALLLSGSRSALLGLMVQGVVAAVLLRKFKAILFSLLLVLTIAIITLLDSNTSHLITTALRLQGGSTHRTVLWLAGADAVLKSPIVGYGANLTVADVDEDVQWGHSSQAFVFKSYEERFGAHNLYITIALTLGLPGLGIFFWLVWVLCRTHVRLMRAAKSYELRVAHMTIVAMVTGALCSGMFESMLVGKLAINNYFWIAVGIVAACEKIESTKSQPLRHSYGADAT